MERKQRPVFVLDISGRPTFAFEAKNMAEAERLVSAPSFFGSLRDFLAGRHEACSNGASIRARAASATEASIYRDLACEFADASGDVLLAHLSDSTTRP